MSVFDRIKNNRDEDLKVLVDLIKEKKISFSKTILKEYFGVARKKPFEFLNYPPILAISIGGSNTKVMLASLKNGVVEIEKVTARTNPLTMTEFDDYFDSIILSEKMFEDYLRKEKNAYLGFSIAVGIKEDVPSHPTKIPYIKNLVARDFEKEKETHNLRKNLEKYFVKRGIPKPGFIYEGDCPLAHLGSVAMTDIEPDEKSLLSICGTGMASADEEHFMGFASKHLLKDDDQDIFPRSETEGGQYQYCIAGKGLFAAMRRAVNLRSKESDSELKNYDLEKYFMTSSDSKTVGMIWESTLSGVNPSDKIKEIKESISQGAYTELEDLAKKFMGKGISAFTNNALATMLYLGRSESQKGHIIFTEGSVCRNPNFAVRFEKELLARASDKNLFKKIGFEMPDMPRIVRDVIKIKNTGNISKEMLKEVDITIIGALAFASADSYLKKR